MVMGSKLRERFAQAIGAVEVAIERGDLCADGLPPRYHVMPDRIVILADAPEDMPGGRIVIDGAMDPDSALDLVTRRFACPASALADS